ncbi:hypothetical protein TIFTF001_052540 [Ficus carica]|uniref:Uncharacterized protein n=1 Tax=Ficus carica TaxID=3494 RepID=A0AA88JHZ1_FICCA|nr:hypothetical protein TIFTF001_052540 [Ficus carica]
MVLKSFPGRSLRNTWKTGGFLFTHRQVASMVSRIPDATASVLGSRGATQVCYSQALWELRMISLYDTFL